MTDASGAFTLTLPPALYYTLLFDDPKLIAAPLEVHEARDQTVTLTGWPSGPAPDVVVDWARQAATPIATTDPAHDVTDLEPLGAIVGDAHVVALGEATHGTREFFQLKHRVLEYLVERKGFTVFAIEANYPESLAVNEYILHGTGDSKKALAGMEFWTWNTEEVLAQIEWMRKWNADPKHTKKVKFIGFDMQQASLAVTRVLEYLTKVDPHAAKTVEPTLAPLNATNEPAYRALSAESRAATEKATVDLLALFDREKERWASRSSAGAWAVARQHAAILSQAAHERSTNWRDESMANDARWILDQEPRGTHMVVWAHNFHVGRAKLMSQTPMGMHLGRALGSDYVSLGFVFDRGEFQAMTPDANGKYVLGSHSVGESAIGDLGEVFHRVGAPLFALDLRHAPPGVVGDWFAIPHAMREIGSTYLDAAHMNTTVVLPSRFDAILYVDETTRARPVPIGRP